MAEKSGRTTFGCLDIFQNILDDISNVCESNFKTGNFSPEYSRILCNIIRNFMSDRANTNLAFTDLLEQYS
jgi:hypothetical protein